MVDFTTLMMASFRKFQLQAEVALLERDATNRQRAFGVELYDLIEKQRIGMRAQIDKTLQETKQADQDPENVESFLKIFQAIENEIREPLERCRKDVTKLPPLFIQRRKEAFGIEVWPIVSKPKWLHECLGEDLKKAMAETKENGEEANRSGETKVDIGGMMTGALKSVAKGTKTTITKAIGKLSPEQREVEACVSVAKEDIAKYENQKMRKMVEIEELVLGGTTLECC